MIQCLAFLHLRFLIFALLLSSSITSRIRFERARPFYHLTHLASSSDLRGFRLRSRPLTSRSVSEQTLNAITRCRVSMQDRSDSCPRVVIVDDDSNSRKGVANYFSKHGFSCKTFGSASDALMDMVGKPLPDAIVTEVAMAHGMSGLDFIRTLRSDIALCVVPVIILTTRGMTTDRIEGYKAGASVYITKPVALEELGAAITSAIQNAKLSSSSQVEPLVHEIDQLRREINYAKQVLQELAHTRKDQQDAPALPLSKLKSYSQFGSALALKSDEKMLRLTPRERDVLEFVCDGLSSKEIAGKLKLSVRWIEKVIGKLFKKTDTWNRNSLVRKAVTEGLIRRSPSEMPPPPGLSSSVDQTTSS